MSMDPAIELVGIDKKFGAVHANKNINLTVAKGTIHGLLRTLHAHGLVEQDAQTDKYQLGPALLELSSGYLDINRLRLGSLAWSELLAVRTGESVRVGKLHDGGVLVVHYVFRPDSSLQTLEVGAILPLHASALGKAIAASVQGAFLDELVAHELPRLTAHTITDEAALRAELARVRDARVAFEREEAVLGEAGIGAPIFDAAGTVVGAIGIAGPVERMVAGDRRSVLAEAVGEAARGISRDLGAPRGL